MSQHPEDETRLTSISFEITMYGIFLSTILALTSNRFDSSEILTLFAFLICAFVFKLFYPVSAITKNFFWRVVTVCISAFFWLWALYQIDNNRADWYRVSVLQPRIHDFVSEAPAYIIFANDDGIITETSENITKLTGYSKEELLGKPITILMRDEKVIRHKLAFAKAMRDIRDSTKPDTGWFLQGFLTIGVKTKSGEIVPSKVYVGAIRWSYNIQFKGDVDVFAIFIPISKEEGQKVLPEETLKEVPKNPGVPYKND